MPIKKTEWCEGWVHWLGEAQTSNLSTQNLVNGEGWKQAHPSLETQGGFPDSLYFQSIVLPEQCDLIVSFSQCSRYINWGTPCLGFFRKLGLWSKNVSLIDLCTGTYSVPKLEVRLDYNAYLTFLSWTQGVCKIFLPKLSHPRIVDLLS